MIKMAGLVAVIVALLGIAVMVGSAEKHVEDPVIDCRSHTRAAIIVYEVGSGFLWNEPVTVH
jgi:hypothetical protein